METLGSVLLSMLAVLFIVVPAAIVLFLVAVWFGLFVMAPRIGRALDRAAADDEGTRD
jgi:uncharacterized SAM-binding protein YcdF (DUF218 family)